jgi:hypothetical protein
MPPGDPANANYSGPGRYRHYKGGHYIVLGLALDEHDRATLRVVYGPASEHSGAYPADFWSRPLDEFNDTIQVADAEWLPRFERIGHA